MSAAVEPRNPRELFLRRQTDEDTAARAALAERRDQSRTKEATLRASERFAPLRIEGQSGQSRELRAELEALRRAFYLEMKAIAEENAAIERDEHALKFRRAQIQEQARFVAVGLPATVSEPAANLQRRQADPAVDTLRGEYVDKSQRDAELVSHDALLTGKLRKLVEHADTLRVEQAAGDGNPAEIKTTADAITNTSSTLAAIGNERAAIALRLPAITSEIAERERAGEAARRARVAKAARPAIVNAVRTVLAAESAVTFANRLAKLTDAQLPAFESLTADSATPAFAQEWIQQLIDSGWLQPSDVQVLQAEAR